MQNAGMPSITVRDVPGATRDELAARAAASGRSLQQFLRAELIKLADRPDNDMILTRARDRVQRTGESLSPDQILELRDSQRRDREMP